MSHELRLSRTVVKLLDRVDRSTEERLRDRLKQLAEDPYDIRISKLIVNQEGLRSSRVGGWRILYTVGDSEQALYVLSIRPRGQAYKDL